MAVDPQRAPGRLLHEDNAYFFCSLTCAGIFATHPERYATRGAAHEADIRREHARDQRHPSLPAEPTTDPDQ